MIRTAQRSWHVDGRRTGAVRRNCGATENLSIFLTLSCEAPKWCAAARSLILSHRIIMVSIVAKWYHFMVNNLPNGK